MPIKQITYILIIVALLLLIPLVAMQFTNEINWTLFDFVVAGILLFGAGLLLTYSAKKIKVYKFRILIIAIILILFLLVWAEFAVGIFGTPFAGSQDK